MVEGWKLSQWPKWTCFHWGLLNFGVTFPNYPKCFHFAWGTCVLINVLLFKPIKVDKTYGLGSSPLCLGVWPFPPWTGFRREGPSCSAPRLAEALLCSVWVFMEGWVASGRSPGSGGAAGTSVWWQITLLCGLSLKLKLNHHRPLEPVHSPAVIAFFEILRLLVTLNMPLFQHLPRFLRIICVHLHLPHQTRDPQDSDVSSLDVGSVL